MGRVSQFVRHLAARVSADEEARARQLLPADAWALWLSMPVADRRHALDVVANLERQGWTDPDLVAAALLHDAAKGSRLRLWHRVGGVLLEAGAPRLLARMASPSPSSWGYAWFLYLHHARLSADAALQAGCSERTAAFIRGSVPPADGPAAHALHLADEAA
ncbi:MAG TPA: hypothetical protein VHK63_08000 [Candidatus Limnocylindria bacterium]|nr:hypothetical protein [Candidatus Limnocylindria bacterium]